MAITEFQERVYTTLLLIPAGRVSSYLGMSKILNTSPRAIGNALRNNPYAPDVPCHRVIAASGFIGGFMGDWQKAPSGVNQTRKRELLEKEGVVFDADGNLIKAEDEVWWRMGNAALSESEVDLGRKLLSDIVEKKDGTESRFFSTQAETKQRRSRKV